jgi:hypothetical protein
MPSYGFFIRHLKGLTMTDVEVSYIKDDVRPPFLLSDVKGADFNRVKAQRPEGGKTFVLRDVSGFTTNQVWQVPDTTLSQVKEKEF